jgi:hypothetical protein
VFNCSNIGGSTTGHFDLYAATTVGMSSPTLIGRIPIALGENHISIDRTDLMLMYGNSDIFLQARCIVGDASGVHYRAELMPAPLLG